MEVLVEMKAIHYMLTIEQEGSFQKAAEVMHISQPALSQYLKRVEGSLSFPLYDRRNRKCALTNSGRIVLERGKELMSTYRLMIKEMEHAAAISKGAYFGWPTGYTLRYFSELSAYMNDVAKIAMHITEDSVENLLNMLVKGDLDLVFVPALYSHPDLEYKTIQHEEFFLAVPKGHLANEIIAAQGMEGYADLSELVDMPFVSIDAPAYTEMFHPFFCGAKRKPHIVFSSKDWSECHYLAVQNNALTVIPYWHVGLHSEEMNYYRISSKNRTFRIFSFVTRKNEELTPDIKAVIDYMIRTYGDEHAGEPVPLEFLSIPF